MEVADSNGAAMTNSLNSAVVAITGGTGSFGSTMLRNLLLDNVAEIRVFSRDENKQDHMRNEIKDERIRFIIGDVRDISSVQTALRGVDYVFHAAALKQVPSCEFFPMQAAATNVTGSSNVIQSAMDNEVKSVVCLSSDKAVYPINAMGMTKALMEKVAQSFARNYPDSPTRVNITRYGNVMMSRGSVIPLFLDQIRAGKEITITDPNMTRFMMSLDDSVNLVKHAFTQGSPGDLFVKKAPACTVATLVEAICKIMKKEGKVEFKYIGTRHGEKLYESLLGTEERARSFDQGDYFKVPLDTRSLDYQIYFDKGNQAIGEAQSYNSHNTTQLEVQQVVELIEGLPEFQKYMRLKS
jgi:UDP-N-acetylglucosamine 4,6-dehydratase